MFHCFKILKGNVVQSTIGILYFIVKLITPYTVIKIGI